MDDTPPPRPPERPPKKPNLRPLFPSQTSEPSTLVSGSFGASDEKLGRPYYFRRPPAPDPPTSPDSPTSQPLTFPATNRLKSTDLDSTSLLSAKIPPAFQHQFTPQSQSLGSIPDSEGSSSLGLDSLSHSNSGQVPFSHQTTDRSTGLLASLPLTNNNGHATQASRSSTPDFPLPPPPPMTPQDVECSSNSMEEEPLPPPPPSASEGPLQSPVLKPFENPRPHDLKLSLSDGFHSLDLSNKGSPPAVPETPPPPLLGPPDGAGDQTEEG